MSDRNSYFFNLKSPNIAIVAINLLRLVPFFLDSDRSLRMVVFRTESITNSIVVPVSRVSSGYVDVELFANLIDGLT